MQTNVVNALLLNMDARSSAKERLIVDDVGSPVERPFMAVRCRMADVQSTSLVQDVAIKKASVLPEAAPAPESEIEAAGE
jgi:rRNA processing protein Gar1